MSYHLPRLSLLSRSFPGAALGLALGAAGCGGAVAPTVETTTEEPARASTPAGATLFAHFDDAPSAILLGREYVYVATKTSKLNGVRSENGALWAVSKATGERYQLWADRFGSAPVGVARSGTELVLALGDGRVVALPERGGESRLAARTFGTPSHIVATGTDAVLRLSSDPSMIVTVGLGDGNVRMRNVPGAEMVSLAAEGDAVYVGMKTASGGRVVRFSNDSRQDERSVELTTAPCAMAASASGLVITDGTTVLRYWDGRSAPASFVANVPSSCALALTQERVFWATTAPEARSQTGSSAKASDGATALLSRAMTTGSDSWTHEALGEVRWVTTDLPPVREASSDGAHVYVLTSDDVVRVAIGDK
ncbi:MAG: hypothetical protein U0174_13475 [Polyangiaceae bacterium]